MQLYGITVYSYESLNPENMQRGLYIYNEKT